VQASDAAGNYDASAAAVNWTIDATPPETTIDSGPAEPTSEADASFTFSSSEPDSSFACQIDGGGFSLCASPQGYTGLPPGLHVFEVQATDAAGNVDETAAPFAWTIDP
jgi:hypothetical protein